MTEQPSQSFEAEVDARAHDRLHMDPTLDPDIKMPWNENIPVVPVDFLVRPAAILASKEMIREDLSKPEVVDEVKQKIHEHALRSQYGSVAADIAKERAEFEEIASVAISEREEALASTEQDPKTGLGNIKAFENDMTQLLEERKDLDNPNLALMVMDLDNFKEANTILVMVVRIISSEQLHLPLKQ